MAAPTDDEYDKDTEILERVVVALEETLRLIDDRPATPPAEQLARLAVGAVRALVPLLRHELDVRTAL